MITFSRFQKNYGAFTALQISDLTISSGVHWLKGRNGSGKTTLFKCVAGLLPFSGNIYLDGLDARKQRVAYRKQVSYGEAEPTYPEFLSAHDLIQFVAQTREASAQQIDSLVNRLGVHEFLYQPCSTYSSGMMKKLSLVLALLGSSKLTLLDEPLITLDIPTVDQLCLIIKSEALAQRSFLLSSHQNFSSEQLTITKTYEVKNKTMCQID